MNIALDPSQVAPPAEALERHIARAAQALLARQHEDGHWCFELEADATIPAEYVLLRHFRGEEPALEARAPDRRLSAAHPGGPWRLAARSRRALRHERQRESLFRAEDDRRRHRRRRTWRVRAKRFSPMAGRRGATSSPAFCSRSTVKSPGAACRQCRSRSCFCRAGFRSISTRCPIGRARSWSRCWCCRP